MPLHLGEALRSARDTYRELSRFEPDGDGEVVDASEAHIIGPGEPGPDPDASRASRRRRS